jgi:hypothetical protein
VLATAHDLIGRDETLVAVARLLDDAESGVTHSLASRGGAGH